ncbi:hypothetical protein KI387_015934, partial [Taxus chinensis]
NALNTPRQTEDVEEPQVDELKKDIEDLKETELEIDKGEPSGMPHTKNIGKGPVLDSGVHTPK